MLGELKPKGPKTARTYRAVEILIIPQSEMTQGFAAGPVYGRARCSSMLGSFITSRTEEILGILRVEHELVAGVAGPRVMFRGFPVKFEITFVKQS